MFVLIVGCGRVGSAIARRMHKLGHEVSVLDENPEAHTLLEQGLDADNWEEAGGSFTVGTALEVDALRASGIERADVVVCSTDGDNTNIVVAQVARKRFQVPKVVVRVLDPLRAEWYSEQGLQTVCPTQVAIEMLTEAVTGEALPVGEEAF
jgi:trk/ktr system potassium uptake protein